MTEMNDNNEEDGVWSGPSEPWMIHTKLGPNSYLSVPDTSYVPTMIGQILERLDRIEKLLTDIKG